MTLQTQELSSARITLPLPAQETAEADLYDTFIRHLRHVPNSRTEIKILSAIQFTADMNDYSDAHVAKILVDQGLRAPRAAFPADFLKYADAALMRTGWEIGGPTKSLLELQSHWNAIGEDRFAAFRGEYSLAGAGAFH